tara:strand:- start:2901 stop:3407 length:507 start_codon:yes stop_codon:yes gene_type:complete
MALSEELKELYASSGSDVILHTLEFNHSTWPEPLRVVSDMADWTADLEDSGPTVTFSRHAFTIQGPNKDANGGRYLAITLDNVSLSIMTLLNLAIEDLNQVPIEVVYRIYVSSDTTGPQNLPPLKLFLKKVTCDLNKITGRAEIVGLVNRKFPNQTYGPKFKSLFDAV